MFDRDAYVALLKMLVISWRKELPSWGGSREVEIQILIIKTEFFLEGEFGVSRDSY